jgi:hypothetical protein
MGELGHANVPVNEPLDEVTVFFGEQKFSPVQYQSFSVGPFIMKTKVRPGESPEDAMARAYAALEKHARAIWPQARDGFIKSVKDAAKAAREAGR